MNDESGQASPSRIVEATVVLLTIMLLATLYVAQVPETLARAHAAEWFALSRPIQLEMHERYALHGDWQLATATPAAHKEAGTECGYDKERIRCRLRQTSVPADMDFVPVATAGAVNWNCLRSDAAERDGSQWFHVCKPNQPFNPQPTTPRER